MMCRKKEGKKSMKVFQVRNEKFGFAQPAQGHVCP